MIKVILHIGMHRTGTSSIQATLKNNPDLIESQGFYYLNTHSSELTNHSEMLSAIFNESSSYLRHLERLNDYGGPFFAETLREKIFNEINGCVQNNVIISGEEICAFDCDQLSRFNEFLRDASGHGDIKTYVYLREPVSLYISGLCEQLAFSPDDYEHILSKPYKSYFKESIDRYESSFQNIELINYSKITNTTKDFFDRIGLFLPENLYLLVNKSKVHEDICANIIAAEILRKRNLSLDRFIDIPSDQHGTRFIPPYSILQNSLAELMEDIKYYKAYFHLRLDESALFENIHSSCPNGSRLAQAIFFLKKALEADYSEIVTYQEILETGINSPYINSKTTEFLNIFNNKTSFYENLYLYSNPDILGAVKEGSELSGFVHYINNGMKENRISFIE